MNFKLRIHWRRLLTFRSSRRAEEGLVSFCNEDRTVDLKKTLIKTVLCSWPGSNRFYSVMGKFKEYIKLWVNGWMEGRTNEYNVMCRGVRVTKLTGSSSDDWIYYHSGYYKFSQLQSIITDLQTFHSTAAHALRFSVSTSRLLATDFNTETSTSNHYEVFLPFLVQSPWNLGTQLKTLLDSS
jgi:hypothetical protein